MERWHAVITEQTEDGKKHFWNTTVDARDAVDAVEQAAGHYDKSRIVGIEVERCEVSR